MCVFTRRLADTQGVIYLRLSSPQPFPLSGGRHAGPLGADLCLVRMWLSVGPPQGQCEGLALPSCSLPFTLAGSEGPAGWSVHSQPAGPLLPPSPRLQPQQDLREVPAIAEKSLQSRQGRISVTQPRYH